MPCGPEAAGPWTLTGGSLAHRHSAVIATAAVVTRDVPPYAIVGGNPATVIRSRFDPATVERLLAVSWWDWPIEKVTRHVRAICGGDVGVLERAA
jgi:virginiamycin A acetyltransferase